VKNHSKSVLVSPRVALVALMLAAGSTAAFAQSQGTEAQRRACTPDVFRLCSSEIPNVDKIIACMKVNKSKLSAPCLAAVNTTQTASATRSMASESQQWCATGPGEKLSGDWQTWCGTH
jgi:hypothetical protein